MFHSNSSTMAAAGAIKHRHSTKWWHPVASSEALDVLHWAKSSFCYSKDARFYTLTL